ncbi:ABC transporter substrate-binding protein [Curtobacterium sp. S6]|uniref:ABC transporter substrate-binding protein n=1 Tax=Curtobacterium sp. S6 TaxID=1479623 RepID=UPI0004AB54B2|nr:ABC transporter substrate-binding protein [Curtobacterium sp. S6]
MPNPPGLPPPPRHPTPNRRTALRTAGFLGGIGLIGALSGCGGAASAANSGKKVRYQGWPQTVLFVELAHDLGYLPTAELEYIGNTTSGPQDIQTVATGDADVGHAFAGAVIKLVEAGADITGVSNYYGSDDKTYVALYTARNSTIKSPRDLIGKTIGMNTLGAHAEAFIYQYLSANGLADKDISDITFVPIPPSDLEISVMRGHLDAAVIDGIAQDLAREHHNLRELGRDVAEFGAFPAGQMVMRREWIEANPELARELASGMDRAIRWARQQPRETVVRRFTGIVRRRDRGEDPAPLQYWKSSGLTNGGVMRAEDFSRWSDWLRDGHIIDGDVSPERYFTNSLIRNAADTGSTT